MRAQVAVLVCVALGISPLTAAIIPRPSPDYVITLPNGSKVHLNQYKGKVIALEFLLTHCPHCQQSSQTLNKLYKEYSGKGFQALGAAINEGAATLVPDYIKNFKLDFPVGVGDRDKTIEYLQHPIMMNMMLPTIVFIDRSGQIRAQYAGTDPFFKEEEKNMRAMIEKLLNDGGAKKSAAPKKKSS